MNSNTGEPSWLNRAIFAALDGFTPDERANFFASGYSATATPKPLSRRFGEAFGLEERFSEASLNDNAEPRSFPRIGFEEGEQIGDLLLAQLIEQLLRHHRDQRRILLLDVLFAQRHLGAIAL